MKTSPILALIDGTNLTHATYHALGGSGSALSAAELLKTVRRRVDAVAAMKTGSTAVSSTMVAFDLPATPERPSWRKQLYPAYKAGRGDRDELLDELLEAAAIEFENDYEVLAAPGVEADDLIATRWQHGIDTGCRMVLVSADRDLWQLANFDNAIADGSAAMFVKLCTLDRDVDLEVETIGTDTKC